MKHLGCYKVSARTNLRLVRGLLGGLGRTDAGFLRRLGPRIKTQLPRRALRVSGGVAYSSRRAADVSEVTSHIFGHCFVSLAPDPYPKPLLHIPAAVQACLTRDRDSRHCARYSAGQIYFFHCRALGNTGASTRIGTTPSWGARQPSARAHSAPSPGQRASNCAPPMTAGATPSRVAVRRSARRDVLQQVVGASGAASTPADMPRRRRAHQRLCPYNAPHNLPSNRP